MKRLLLVVGLILAFIVGISMRERYVHADVNSPSSLDSEVFLVGGNGFGSSDPIVRRFSTVKVNIGTAITYTDDPAYGASFLINTPGVYSISYTDWRHDTGNTFYVTSDTSLPASNPPGSGPGQAYQLCAITTGPYQISGCSATVLLDKGDVIRPWWWAGGGFPPNQPFNADDLTTFIITRVR